MIAKKNSEHDLEQKRTAFFQLGLLVISSLVLAAFTYTDVEQSQQDARTSYEKRMNLSFEEVVPEKQPEPEEILDEPETPPALPQVSDPNPDVQNIVQKQNTKTIPKPQALGQFTKVNFGDVTKVTGGGSAIQGEVFEFTDVDAKFPGGAFSNYIATKVEYPSISVQWGDEGTVFVSFVVEKDGSVSNVKVEQGVTPELNKEAIRVVKSSPKWKPGEINFEPVRTRVRVPIHFMIEG